MEELRSLGDEPQEHRPSQRHKRSLGEVGSPRPDREAGPELRALGGRLHESRLHLLHSELEYADHFRPEGGQCQAHPTGLKVRFQF